MSDQDQEKQIALNKGDSEVQVKASELDSTPTAIAAMAPATAAVHERELEYVPDGGREAWTVVLGSTLALFASAGMINSYGAFQDYYESTLLPSSSSASISLIGSLQVFFLYAGGPLTGRLFDAYGATFLIPFGSFLCVFAMMMISLAQKDQAYQLFLSQGVLFGIGIAFLFNPSVAVVGHWFRRHRATAIGIVVSGGAVGGIVFPILLQHLIPIIGFGWTVRIIGFIIMACFIVACLTIKTRLPLSGHASWRTAVDLHGFKDPRYVLATIAGFLISYAYFIPYFYIQIYASFRGVSPAIANYLLVIMNAMNIPARILPGMLADRFGPLTCFIPSGAVCTILTLAVWLPSRGAGATVAFSALYGLFSGPVPSLLATYIATITPREVYGARLGSVYIFVSIATLIGTPTGGALLKVVDDKHFRDLIVFTGVILAAGTVALVGSAIAGNVWMRGKLGLGSRATD